jgi:hypothetical protein
MGGEGRMKNRKARGLIGVLMVVLLAPGCSSKRYEVDYHYEILKKASGGAVQTVVKGSAKRATSGERGGGTQPGGGRINSLVRQVTADTATIETTFPDGSTTSIRLAPQETKEYLSPRGNYGIRLALDRIRRQ